MIIYEISRQEWEEDRERSASVHSCGLCGVDYDITARYPAVEYIDLFTGKSLTEPVFIVTDDCECHDEFLLAEQGTYPKEMLG